MAIYGLFQSTGDTIELLHSFLDKELAEKALDIQIEYSNDTDYMYYYIKEIKIVNSLKDIYPELKKVTFCSYNGEEFYEDSISTLNAILDEDKDFLNGNIKSKDTFFQYEHLSDGEWLYYRDYLSKLIKIITKTNQFPSSVQSIDDFKGLYLNIYRPTNWSDEELENEWKETFKKAFELFLNGLTPEEITKEIRK